MSRILNALHESWLPSFSSPPLAETAESGSLSRAGSWLTGLLLAAALFAASGCERPEILKIHYLEGFVPGSRAVFHPAKIAIARVTGSGAAGVYHVGAVYDADGAATAQLAVSDIGALIQDAIVMSAEDAGLAPVRLDHEPAPAALPRGVDLLLTTRVAEISCVKRFTRGQTIHGQYFTMHSRVRLAFALFNRQGQRLYEGEMTGVEEEPPAPVGGEVFLPLETEPDESLSVALSRAVGALFIQPALQRALPLRNLAPRASPTPLATPAPSAPHPHP